MGFAAVVVRSLPEFSDLSSSPITTFTLKVAVLFNNGLCATADYCSDVLIYKFRRFNEKPTFELRTLPKALVKEVQSYDFSQKI